MSHSLRRLGGGALLIALVTLLITPSFAGEDIGRKIKQKTDPAYPELARSMRLTGTVKVEVTIAPNGTIKATRVIGGNPVLVESALGALKRWKFEPAADETTQVVEFRFSPQQQQ